MSFYVHKLMGFLPPNTSNTIKIAQFGEGMGEDMECLMEGGLVFEVTCELKHIKILNLKYLILVSLPLECKQVL